MENSNHAAEYQPNNDGLTVKGNDGEVTENKLCDDNDPSDEIADSNEPIQITTNLSQNIANESQQKLSDELPENATELSSENIADAANDTLDVIIQQVEEMSPGLHVGNIFSTFPYSSQLAVPGGSDTKAGSKFCPDDDNTKVQKESPPDGNPDMDATHPDGETAQPTQDVVIKNRFPDDKSMSCSELDRTKMVTVYIDPNRPDKITVTNDIDLVPPDVLSDIPDETQQLKLGIEAGSSLPTITQSVQSNIESTSGIQGSESGRSMDSNDNDAKISTKLDSASGASNKSTERNVTGVLTNKNQDLVPQDNTHNHLENFTNTPHVADDSSSTCQMITSASRVHQGPGNPATSFTVQSGHPSLNVAASVLSQRLSEFKNKITDEMKQGR